MITSRAVISRIVDSAPKTTGIRLQRAAWVFPALGAANDPARRSATVEWDVFGALGVC